MTSESSEKVEVAEVTSSNEQGDEQVKQQNLNPESTFTIEEYTTLKTKVEKLENLLTKCRGTIVNNKEKVKQLNEDKEGIQHKFEHQLNKIKQQYEDEINSKFSVMQEQIAGLTEDKDKLQNELNDVINLKGDELINKMRLNHEKEKENFALKINSLNQELSQIKLKINYEKSATTCTPQNLKDSAEECHTTDQASVKVDPEEHKKVLKQLEARSEELIGLMEERTILRKELISQRERFTLVLERYDSQMKVVQEELRLRMMPGPLEASMGEQVAEIMQQNAEVVDKSKEKSKGDKKCASGVEKRLEETEEKIKKLCVLLEKAAKKADDKEAECGRWNTRFSELNEKHNKSSNEFQETVKRLEKQVSEMTIKENDLNEELEKTRTENGDMLRVQRSEMTDLQKVVDRLVANEESLKTQMNEIKSQCDGEVAKANEENEKAMNKLKEMFEENKKAVTDLFEQLTQSKQKSNELVKEYDAELEYRYRQLEAARTYINCLNDGKSPPAEPPLSAIFSNLPNFIYVDDVSNGHDENKDNTEEKNGEDKCLKDESSNIIPEKHKKSRQNKNTKK